MGREPDRDPAVAIGAAQRATQGLVRALLAGGRALCWITGEEDRALSLAEDAGAAMEWPVHTWSAASGTDGDRIRRPLPTVLTDLLTPGQPPALWVIFEGAAALASAPPAERRALREVAQRSDGPAVLLIESGPSEVLAAVPELAVEHLPPPDTAMLIAQFSTAVAAMAGGAYPEAQRRLGPAAAAITRAAIGLPQWAFDRLLAEAVLAHGTDPAAIARFIGQAKPSLLDRGGLLDVAEPVPIDEVGGLPHLKAWLTRRALALRPAAAAAGIAPPRGVLLLGVQGCGKSLAARACASLLGLPLVRLESGRLFGGTLGQSEANLRRVTALVDQIAPVVLWIDEIDKGLAGLDGPAGDAGTTARVVGSLLTWLQQRSRPVFVAATANRVDGLPPELLRRGRLDEIFFVDLPDAEQRAEILDVHLRRVPQRTLGRIPPTAEPPEALVDLARTAEGFSGAELEAALTEARLAAFEAARPLAVADLAQALHTTVPLSTTRAESIEALRRWAAGRARRA